MEELTLTTPSILFSAISLIMLAYTNRFLAYASVIRSLKTEHEQNPTPMAQRQIDNLRKRLYMARCKFSEYPACCCAWFVRCLSMWDGNWLLYIPSEWLYSCW